ncbi:MAG: hypothetical protein KME21_13885 [Desmonostoc vinosum HA7617-LM4]|jgi:CCR4-NOT transcriptional regulation complex NOT5 subunit|nr:hypothetical protein [Desmonostoc vinosum HA7617-LM4]
MAHQHGNSKNLIPYKSQWRHKPTKSIRVPEIFAEQILAYAHQLDAQKIDMRIELDDTNWLIVIAPCDPRGNFQAKAKSIQGYRYHRASQTWWYRLEKIEEVVATFPECEPDENVKQILALIQIARAKQNAADMN